MYLLVSFYFYIFHLRSHSNLWANTWLDMYTRIKCQIQRFFMRRIYQEYRVSQFVFQTLQLSSAFYRSCFDGKIWPWKFFSGWQNICIYLLSLPPLLLFQWLVSSTIIFPGQFGLVYGPQYLCKWWVPVKSWVKMRGWYQHALWSTTFIWHKTKSVL